MQLHSIPAVVKIVTTVSTAALALSACSTEDTGTMGAGSAPTQNLKPATFMLSWAPDTNHVGVYVAKNKGWFAEAGLDVSIVGVAQAGAEQAVNTGLADFALSTMANVGALSLKGVDLKQVLQVQQRPSAIWCALESNDEINRPKDLDGKTFATFGANEDSAIIKRMIEADGGSGEFDSVTVGTSTFQVMEAGQADFGGFYSTWEGVQAALSGPDLNCFRGEDYGVPGNPNEIGVVTKSDTATNDPEFVRAFVQAVQRGYEYAYENPDEAADILVSEAADANIDPQLAKASMKLIVDEHYWGDPAAISDGTFVFGQADIPQAQEYFDFIAESDSYTDEHDKVTHTAPRAEDLATDEFLAK